LCEGAPRQKAAESRKIPESGSVIPREGVEISQRETEAETPHPTVIPREGVEIFLNFKKPIASLQPVIPREGVEIPNRAPR
jgi:hypothetical protein